MICDDEEMLRVLDLRFKTTPIRGSLCSVKDPKYIWNAMDYFQIWNHGEMISHPYTELSPEFLENMPEEIFKIFVEYTKFWIPRFTKTELCGIIRLSKKYNYSVTKIQDMITFGKDV